MIAVLAIEIIDANRYITLAMTIQKIHQGRADHQRAPHGGGPTMSPLLFSASLFSRPFDLLSIFEDGLGGGAIGVSLYGLLGGYALSGRGPRWARIVSGAVAGTAIRSGL